MQVSRHEAKFDAAAEVPVDAPELAAALAGQAGTRSRERKVAIACFLAGGEGWREARAVLGGAFADNETDERRKDG